MPRTTIYIVSDENESVEKAKAFFGPQGMTVTAYNPTQWRDGLEHAEFRSQLAAGTPALSAGFSSNDYSNVLPFPGTASVPTGDTKVVTMEELESKAIESAIMAHRGNLTEAAKALGIGRATLYRKVKQFHIDPTQARKKRVA